MSIYDEYKDDYLDNAPEEPEVCNNSLDHLEDDEGLKWGIALCFLKSEIIFFDSIEEHDDILFETLERNQVLNSEILDEKSRCFNCILS